jgi:hypothetical protein
MSFGSSHEERRSLSSDGDRCHSVVARAKKIEGKTEETSYIFAKFNAKHAGSSRVSPLDMYDRDGGYLCAKCATAQA